MKTPSFSANRSRSNILADIVSSLGKTAKKELPFLAHALLQGRKIVVKRWGIHPPPYEWLEVSSECPQGEMPGKVDALMALNYPEAMGFRECILW